MIYGNLSISKDATILQALQQMDLVRHKMLLVFDATKFYSIITIGEIQRAIIGHKDMSTPIVDIINVKRKAYASVYDNEEKIKALMLRIRAEFMPVLNDNGEIIKLYKWSDLFSNKSITQSDTPIDIPVVIMAGGKGTRLKPITNVIPKPLVPIGEKTILEEIMDRFEDSGCKHFYMSVNYKSDIIRYYLNKLDHKYNIDFFEEERPLGTIGSVSLLRDKIDTPFFVSNCDIIIDQDYRDVYSYHIDNNNDITIVTAIKSQKIPYGVVEAAEDGILTALKEKPELTYMINTGVYILNHNCIDVIPTKQFFHITQLIEKVKESGGRVGCFPVGEGAWHDMGEWSEYLKQINISSKL